jgi:hypothetical protein
VAYDRLCRENPAAPDCGLPLYWPARPMVVSAKAGMHRVGWDLRYQPLGEGGGRGGGNAIPHHTYPSVSAPWAPPGSYVVRLTANGNSYTQPLSLHLDPRVKTPALALATLASLTREMYDGAKGARVAADQARALAALLEGPDAAALKEQLTALAPPAAAGAGRGGGRGAGGGRGGGRGGGVAAPTLDSVSASMMAAAMALQAAEVAPTARDVASVAEARRQAGAVMAKWTKLRTVDLAVLNAKRKAAGQAAIPWPPK